MINLSNKIKEMAFSSEEYLFYQKICSWKFLLIAFFSFSGRKSFFPIFFVLERNVMMMMMIIQIKFLKAKVGNENIHFLGEVILHSLLKLT